MYTYTHNARALHMEKTNYTGENYICSKKKEIGTYHTVDLKARAHEPHINIYVQKKQ